ncbi:MAG: hypothetical protein EXR50_05840 [Dehalococcoidia bacterium]|nr:hypothetical protein [Dehalococcoidia bacterium]
MTIKIDDMYEKVAVSLVEARIRIRALLELLEEKQVLLPGEFEDKAGKLWESDFSEIYEEITTPAPEDLTTPETHPAPKPLSADEYAIGMLQNLIDEAIGSRIRIRAILEVMEDKGIFAKGEFEAKAEAVWERDFEEMTLEFYKKFS